MKPSIELSPRLQSRYQIIEPLGEAMLGQTFLARELGSADEWPETVDFSASAASTAIAASGGRKIVLKVLDMNRAEHWKQIELFERGAQTLQNLSHPHIPAFYDAFYDEESGRFYLAQSFIEGIDLKQLLATDGPFDEAWLRKFLHAMLDILDYLHGFSPPVIHRDIKPSNIMARRDGTFALIDFDVVQTLVPDDVGGSTVAGTSGYMPPEQLIGRAEPASDLYSLGVTALHLATGTSPLELPMSHGEFQIEALSKDKLSSELTAWLKRMVAAAPDQRFASAADARAALRRSRPLPARRTSGVQLSTETLESLIPFETPASFYSWSQIRLKGQNLEVILFSRPQRYIRLLFKIAAALGLLGAAGISGIIHQDVTGLAWLIAYKWWILKVAAGLTGIIWLGLHMAVRPSVCETGIEQRLTISPENIELKERSRIKWWGGGRRALKNWTIPRDELLDVHVRRSPSVEFEQTSLEEQMRQARFLEQRGLVFEDRQGTERIVGAELVHDPAFYGFDERMRDIEKSHEAISAYLEAGDELS